MRALRAIADKEEGWLAVTRSMIDVIPLDDPLGPAAVCVLLDECPLPAKETIDKVLMQKYLGTPSTLLPTAKLLNEHLSVLTDNTVYIGFCD